MPCREIRAVAATLTRQQNADLALAQKKHHGDCGYRAQRTDPAGEFGIDQRVVLDHPFEEIAGDEGGDDCWEELSEFEFCIVHLIWPED